MKEDTYLKKKLKKLVMKNMYLKRQKKTCEVKEKMSKSKNNGIDPEKLASEYGADASQDYSVICCTSRK